MSDAAELTETEYWILLSLDDADMLPGLLLDIEHGERVPARWPFRWRLQMKQVRPRLEVAEAAAAVTSLAERSLIEVREARPGTWRGGEHPYDNARRLALSELTAVLDDPANWLFPAEGPQREFAYWVGETDAGLAAYRRYVEMSA